MILRVLGSNSKGNCYLLIADNEVLIIEAGVRLIEVKKALLFKTHNIVGCLISHVHGDHAGNIKEYADAGITILTSESVRDNKVLSLYDNRVRVVEAEKGYKLGQYSMVRSDGFKVIPFPVHHDVPTFGFLIYHQECGNIMFITDTYMCEYNFPHLNHVIIECNYADDILEDNIINRGLNPLMRPRLLYSHMELESCKNILRRLDLSNVVNIVLVHLSDGNSNEKRFVSEIAGEFFKITTAANKEVDIDFSLNPY